MNHWPCWDPTAMNRVIYHRIKTREGDVIRCEEREQIFFIKLPMHLDKYTISTKYTISEIIEKGNLSGDFKAVLSECGEGTSVDIDATIVPTNILIKLIDKLVGDRILRNFWEDLLDQLEEYAKKY